MRCASTDAQDGAQRGHQNGRGHAARRRVLAVACALGTVLLLAPSAAQADPDSSAQELHAKINKLTDKAEVFTEKYNGQRLQLQKAKKHAHQARVHAKQLRKRLDRAREEISELVATAYKTGGMRKPWMLMAAENPDDVLSRAATLAQMSKQQSAELRELQATVKQAAKTKERKARKVAEVKSITKDLEKKKKHVKSLVAQAKDNLQELRERQAAQQAASRAQARAPIDAPDNLGSGVRARALEIALNQQGDPYVWGADGPGSFDCSGLIVYAYGQVGVDLPHYTGALWDSGTHISRDQLQPGDLVFTSSHHVGLYVSDGRFVNAPHTGTVVQVEPIESFYGAVRIG